MNYAEIIKIDDTKRLEESVMGFKYKEGDKFILEITERTDVNMSPLAFFMLSGIDIPFTEDMLNRLMPYQEAEENSRREAIEKAKNDGERECLEIIRGLYFPPKKGGMTNVELKEAFGGKSFGDILCEDYTYIKNTYDTYKKNKEKIEVGDIVTWTNYLKCKYEILVTSFGKDNIFGIDTKNASFVVAPKKDKFEKNGKHIDLQSVFQNGGR